MNAESNFSEMQLSALKEIGNIGAGNACTALSVLLNKTVDMSIPSIRALDYSKTPEHLGGADNKVIAIEVKINGDLSGCMFHVVQKDFITDVINSFYEKNLDDISQIDEMDRSVLNEMSNITSGMYANSLATLTGMYINIDTPAQTPGTVGEILQIPMKEYSNISNKIIFVDETFTIGGKQSNCNMLLILDEQSLSKLFQSLGIEIIE